MLNWVLAILAAFLWITAYAWYSAPDIGRWWQRRRQRRGGK